jgi:MtN3 and saliva related transmembrane protein
VIFKKILESSIEYQNYIQYHELNIVTATLIIAILATFIQGWGILKQNKKIWKNRSGKALPISFFSFQFFYCLGYLIYGLEIHSVALIISDLVGLLYIPIIIGLIKFKRHENGSFKEEIILSPVFILIVPCILLVDKTWSLLIILALGVLVSVKLIRGFIKTGETKNISPKYIVSFLISSFIWLWYGYEIDDLGLIISSTASVLAAGLFLLLYLRYKKRSTQQKSPTND